MSYIVVQAGRAKGLRLELKDLGSFKFLHPYQQPLSHQPFEPFEGTLAWNLRW